jgi:ubiquitin carboxyl-terminal hydrolase 34
MASIYKLYEELKSRRNFDGWTIDNAFAETFRLETIILVRKMSVLPTAREAEALPELRLLRDVAENVKTNLRSHIGQHPTFEKYLVEESFAAVAIAVIKTKLYKDKEIIRVADSMFVHLVAWATLEYHASKIYFLNLLNVIIDKSADYYKTNGKEQLYSYPFGEPREPDPKIVEFVNNLREGMEVDCIRHSGGKRIWTRGKICGMEMNFIKIRYIGEYGENYIQHKYFEIAPKGSRETDIEWREGLKPGDLIDYDNTVYRPQWKPNKITDTSVTELVDGSSCKMLSLVEISPSGQEIRDFYANPQQVKVYSPFIARPGTRTGRNLSSFDDTEDATYLPGETKPRFAILRNAHNSACSSIYFVKYINVFGENQGFETMFSVMKDERNPDVMGAWVRLIQSMVDNLIQPIIAQHGVAIYEWIKEFGIQSTEKNMRNFSINHLMAITDSVYILTQRIFPVEKARQESNIVMFKIAFLCIKSEYLQKQLFGAKMLETIEGKSRTGENGLTKQAFAEMLQAEGLFEKIIKGHPSLVAKGASILKILFAERVITDAQLEVLWDQIIKTDIESKKALICLLKEIVYEMTGQEMSFILNKFNSAPEQIQENELDLINTIKRFRSDKIKDIDVSATVNEIMWNLLQKDEAYKKDFYKQLCGDFVRYLDDDAPLYTHKVVQQLRAKVLPMRNLKLLSLLVKNIRSGPATCSIIKNENVVSDLVNDLVESLEEKCIQTYPPAKAAKAREPGFFNQDSVINSFPPADLKELSKRLKFFDTLATNCKDLGQMFPFSEFEKIWKVMMKHCITEPSLQRCVSSYISDDGDLSQTNILHNFLYENLPLVSLPNRQEFFQFLVQVIIRLNVEKRNFSEREIKQDSTSNYMQLVTPKLKNRKFFVLMVPVEKVDGFQPLWELFLSCEMFSLEHAVSTFIAQTVTPSECVDPSLVENAQLYSQQKELIVQKCFDLIGSNQPRSINKGAGLLEKLMRAEETRGLGDLRSLISMKLSEKIVVNFEKNTKYQKERSKVHVNETDSVGELILQIGADYHLTFEALSIQKNNEVFGSMTYSSTVDQVGIVNNDLVLVNELPIATQPIVPLLDHHQEFTPQALEVFKEIFEGFSKNGRMTPADLAAFTVKATENNHCTAEDERITQVFTDYDRDRKGYLTQDEFIKFFQYCASLSEHKYQTVYRNLNSLGYKSTLQTKKQILCQTTSNKFTIRRDLFLNKDFLQKLLTWTAVKPEPGQPAFNLNDLFNVFSLIEFITPPASVINALIDNPVAELTKNLEHPFALQCKLVVLYNLVFDSTRIIKFFYTCGLPFPKQEAQLIPEKLLDFNFFDQFLQKYGYKNIRFSPYFMKLYELVFTTGLGLQNPEFLSEMKSFNLYFTNQRNKQAKKTKPIKASDKTDDKVEPGSIEDILQKIRPEFKAAWTQFVEKVNMDKLNQHILSCLTAVSGLGSTDLSFSHKSFLKSIMVLSCASNQISNAAFTTLLTQNDKFVDMMIDGLLHPSPHVRIHFKSLFAYISANASDMSVKKVLLDRLINCIKTRTSTRMHVAIEVASHLLVEIAEAKNSNVDLHSQFNLSNLFVEFGNKLMKMTSSERIFEDRDDHNLNAVLTFLDKLVTADPAILKEIDPNFKTLLLRFVFKNCLFNIENSKIDINAVLCKTRKSRESALILLNDLCKGDPKCVFLLMIIGFGPLTNLLPEFSKTNSLFVDSDRRSDYGFIGIKNLGCICYMIAMLQQFYCTPAFRYGILMADDNKPQNMVEVKHRKIDDNVFHQLQKMFAYLDNSQRSDFNPVEFCLSYKDHAGEPVNCLVQQDAQEFLNMIFDKLESSLKSTPFKGILESVYGGQTANVFTCKKCGFVRQNVELFYNLSLEVKNFANITESFEKFIKEEIISDYLCSNCKEKCDVSKRCFLKTPPNVMIVHLQKIIFDLEALVNVKISSRYQFPMQMNVRRFMAPPEVKKPAQGEDDIEGVETLPPADKKEAEPPADDLKDEDFEYKLVGVVIHKGNAEYGHYISLINVNRSDPNRSDISYDHWLEFDDSRISRFDMSNFDEECFGAQEEKDFPLVTEQAASKSAYILVYDKVKKSNIKIHFAPENLSEKDKIIANLIDPAAYKFDKEKLDFETNFFNIKSYSPPQYQKEILDDNYSLVLEQQLLNPHFITNFSKILSSSDLPRVHVDMPQYPQVDSQQAIYANSLIKFLPIYIYQVFPYANENQDIYTIIDRLESALAVSPKLVLPFFIEQIIHKNEVIFNLLVHSNNNTTKNSTSNYLSSVITILVRTFNITNITEQTIPTDIMQAFVTMTVNNRTTDETTTRWCEAMALFSLKKFIDGFLTQIATSGATNVKKLGFVFKFLNRTASLNPPIANYFLSRDLLTQVHNIYNGLDSPKTFVSDRLLSPLISIHATMLNNLKQKRMQEPENVNYTDYYNFFVRAEFFERIFKEDSAVSDSIEDFVRTVCYEDRKVTDLVISIALRTLNREVESTLTLNVLMALLRINDSLSDLRIKRILGVPVLHSDTHNSGRQVYGLGLQTKLRSSIYNFPSLYFLDKSLIEIMQHQNEVKMMVAVYYLCDLAVGNPRVMDYLTQLPPTSYASASIFDCWPDFIRRFSLRQMNLDTYKSEIKFISNSVLDKIKSFQQSVALQAEHAGLAKDAQLFFNDEELNRPVIQSFFKRHIIGKTISSRLVYEHKEAEAAEKAAGLRVFIDRVSLMESLPTGISNSAFPDDYDYSLRYSAETNKEFWNFIDVSQQRVYASLSDYVDDDEDFVTTRPERKSSEEIESLKGCFFNEDHVLRIAAFNKTLNSYYAKISVAVSLDNRVEVFDIVSDLSPRTLLTLERKPGAKRFGEVTISISSLRTADSAAKGYDDSLMPPPKKLHTLQL